MDSSKDQLSLDSDEPMRMLTSQRSSNVSPILNMSTTLQSRLNALKHTARSNFSGPALSPSNSDRNVQQGISPAKRRDDGKNAALVVCDKKVVPVKAACDINGSLLALAAKLHQAEFTVHGRHTNPSPPTSLYPRGKNPLCVSRCLGAKGFGFTVEARKRPIDELDKGMNEDDDVDIKVKRYCTRVKTTTRSVESNSLAYPHEGEANEFDDVNQTNDKEFVAKNWTSNREEFVPKVSLGNESIVKMSDESRVTNDRPTRAIDPLPSDEFFETRVDVLKQLYIAMKQAMPDQFEAIPELPWVHGPALWPIFSSARVADDVEICTYHDHNVDTFREQNHRFRHRVERYTSTLTDAQNDQILEMGIAHAIYSQRTVLANYVVASLRRLNLAGICATACEATNLSGASTKEHNGATLSSSLRRFMCDRCPYHTDNKSHLVRHKNSIHLTHRPFPCYVCLKPFSRAENVRAHFRSAHPLSNFNPDLVRMVKVDDVDSKSRASPSLSDAKMETSTASDGELNVSPNGHQGGSASAPRHLTDHLTEEEDGELNSAVMRLPTFSNKRWNDARSDREQSSINHVIRDSAMDSLARSSTANKWSDSNGTATAGRQKHVDYKSRDGKHAWKDYYSPANGNVVTNTGKSKHSRSVASVSSFPDPDNEPYCCELCSSRFVTVKLLEVHSVTAHRRRLFVCRNCDFYFTFDAAEYHTHRACVHGEVVGGETMSAETMRLDGLGSRGGIDYGTHSDWQGSGHRSSAPDWQGSGHRSSAALLSMLSKNAAHLETGKTVVSALTNGALDLSSTVVNQAIDKKGRTDLNSQEYSNQRRGGGMFMNNSGNRILPLPVDSSKNYGNAGSGRASSEIDRYAARKGFSDAAASASLNSSIGSQRKLHYKTAQLSTPKRETPSSGNLSEDGAASNSIASRTNSPASSSRKLLLDGRSPMEAFSGRYQNSSPGGGMGVGSENPLDDKRRRIGGTLPSTSNKKADIVPRSNKTFFCPLCPERDPFRYHKSFDKHMRQHAAGAGGGAAPSATLMSFVSAPQPGVRGLEPHNQPMVTHATVPPLTANKRPAVVAEVWNNHEESSLDSDDSDVLAYHDDPNDRDYK